MATVIDDALVLTLDWHDALAEIMWPFVKSQRAFYPMVSLGLRFPAGGEPVTLTIGGPGAYMAVLKKQLGDKLKN